MPTSHETRFAEQVVALGLLDQASVDKAAKVAETIREHDKYADVRTVLVGRKKLTDEQGDEVLQKMGEVIMFCPVCGKKYAANPYDPSVPCPADDSPLKPVLAPKAAQPIKQSTSEKVKAPKPQAQASSGAASGDPFLGRKLGQFRLTGLWAADSTSRTYKAQLDKTDMPFMVKVLTSDDRVVHRRFIREAKYAGLIQNAHVVNILASGADGNISYIATEFIDGVPLDQVIKAAPDGQLEMADVVRISLAVLDGLDAAHQIGIVHRNIKPNCIIVTDDGARIVNFNSARLADDTQVSEQLTAPGASLGTPHYMAPEQIQSSRVDFRADLYAFGSTLFHMLCGHPPFTSNVVTEIVKAKLRTEAPKPSSVRRNVPPAMDEVVATLLAREPGGRYASAGHAIVALRAIHI